jgi:hypothetical protein
MAPSQWPPCRCLVELVERHISRQRVQHEADLSSLMMLRDVCRFLVYSPRKSGRNWWFCTGILRPEPTVRASSENIALYGDRREQRSPGSSGARLSQSEWRECGRRRASWSALPPIPRTRDLLATELIPLVEKVPVAMRERTGLQEGTHRAFRRVFSHLNHVMLTASNFLRKRKKHQFYSRRCLP